MLRKFFIPLVVALIGAVAAVYWYAGMRHASDYNIKQAVPVERFKLRNGLTVVVMPNDRIPAVVHALFVKAGAADDGYGTSGLAHFLEHLMFTGTKNFPEGEYDRIIVSLGGEHNAYTTRDYTTYYATIAKEHLGLLMSMEADRLEHLTLDKARAERELSVIQEERKWRVDNQLSALLDEEMDAVQLLNHPYRQPMIGWPEEISSLTVEQAKAFLAKYYRPSNMVLVVAGDVSVEQVKKLAQQYYAPLRAGIAPTRHWPKEVLPSRTERRVILRDARVEQPKLIRSYVAPSINFGAKEQTMALELFAQYLGGGTTSVLYNELVRHRQLATSVSAGYGDLYEGPSRFTIVAEPAAGVSLEQLESALNEVLRQTLSTMPDAKAVARAKSLLTAETVYAQDGLSPLAHLMGQLYVLGLNETYFYHWSGRLGKVTETQMMEAARATVVQHRAVTGVLVPEQKGAVHAQ